MPAPTTPPPAHLGRYRVVRRLGAGGMAEVFLARSTGAEGIEKVLVVKRVLPTFARSPKFISMFVDEAKVAMRLNHPNIVQVYAFEQVKGEFLLAMEFVDGLDLGRLVSAARRAGRRLAPALCAYIVSEIAKGLDYAHHRKDESGTPMEIVHRDVSPQNALISYDGIVKIADFGIARARLVSEETGVIKGKFSYMSPEQARGQRVDRRSDVYSLGVLLAELLMNRPMYPGQQGMEVLEQVRDGNRTMPRSVDPSVPPELDEIVRRATSLDRELRYPSSRSLAGALNKWLHMQDEVLDAVDLERFIAEIAPREVTSPDGTSSPSRGAGTADTHASLPHVGARELRERRNVVVVHGRFRGEMDDRVTGVERTGPSVDAAAVRVLEDIAFKYHAILDWPDGTGKRGFRLLIGLGRVSVDDPLHATRMGMDVLDALEGLSVDLLSPLNASIGLSRGVVATVRAAAGRRLRYQPVDGVFEVARELGDQGDAGEILATGEVYRLARRAFSFDEDAVREITVTGTQAGPRRFRAYRLRGARTREERAFEARAMAGQVGLFGRTQEIKAIASAYDETSAGRKSSYLCVLGELGAGKSALVAAALAELDPAPRVLRVECVFGSSEVPYEAVAELVREACGIAEDASSDEARAQLAKVMRRVVPSATRSADLEALEPLVAPQLKASEDPGDHSASLIRAVRHLLGGLAAQGPCVVWVDALQFVDSPSLSLMARLMSHTYEVPLMVIVSSRQDERVEEILGNVARIDLAELDDADRRALITARFGGAKVPPDIQQAIVHRAGGNPFFLIELVDALLDREAVRVEGEGPSRRVVRRSGAAFALPTTLEDVIAARLAELPEPERHALRWLAVTGPGLRVQELRVLTGEELEDELIALEQRGLVQRRTGGGLFFPSAVVRHVAYESIDSADRIRMHRMMANYLTALDLPISPARLAHHREQAGDRSGAADAYLAAGKAAHRMHSLDEAMRFFGRALALTPAHADGAFEAHEAREQILRSLGRRTEQRTELEALRDLADRTRKPRHTAIAFSRLARYDLDASRPAGVEAMLRRALDASIEADDKSAEIEALRLLGQLRRDQGDTLGAIEALDRALARAQTDERWLSARGQTLVQKAILQWRAAQIEDSLASSAEAVVIFRRLGLKAHEANALSSLGVALAHRGAFEDAIKVIRASVLLDREAGDRIHLGRKVSNIGQLYGELGHVDHAMGFLRRALDVFETVADQSAQADALCAISELLALQIGDFPAAEGVLEDARAIAERINDPYDLAHVCLVRGSIQAARGDHEGAAQSARDAIRHAKTAGARGYEQLGIAARAEALARTGHLDEALHLARQLADRVRGRDGIERAEHIHLMLARAFALAGEAGAADEALAHARRLVDARLDQIGDGVLRGTYLDAPHVRAIRQGDLTA
ncbi:MAG: protein kinase [Sandaracinaceae bacterium]|nr:protein kinase [Sandaracinaceae bacterium]